MFISYYEIDLPLNLNSSQIQIYVINNSNHLLSKHEIPTCNISMNNSMQTQQTAATLIQNALL